MGECVLVGSGEEMLVCDLSAKAWAGFLSEVRKENGYVEMRYNI